MRKRDELTDPNSCMSRAADDEMTFVLLARDVAAPDTIRDWVRRRIELGKNQIGDAQTAEALECATKMEQQRAFEDMIADSQIEAALADALKREARHDP